MRVQIKNRTQFFPTLGFDRRSTAAERLAANQKRLTDPLTEESQRAAAFCFVCCVLSAHRREMASDSAALLRKLLDSDMDIDRGGVFNKTDDYDYNDTYEYKEDPEEGERTSHQVVWLPVFYSVLVIVGLLTNGLLLTVLAQKRRRWRVLDSFFLQLGIVDVLLLMTLPLWGAQANQQCEKCPETLFTVFRAVFNINFYIGTFLLVCICLYYFLTTIRADCFFRHRAKFGVFSSLLVWLISLFLTGLDWTLLESDKDILQGKAICVHKYPESGVDWLLGLRLLHLTVGFLLPVAFFVIISSHLLQQQRSSGIQKKRPLIVISVLMGVFLVVWLPYNIALVADVFCYTSTDFLSKSLKFSESLKTALTFTSAVGCINACLRPFLYFLLYGTFRRRIRDIFKCDRAGHDSSLWELDAGQNASCDQSQPEIVRLQDLLVQN